jgi:hypothetical protein
MKILENKINSLKEYKENLSLRPLINMDFIKIIKNWEEFFFLKKFLNKNNP